MRPVVDRASWAADASVSLVEVAYHDGAAETYVLAERIDDPSVARALLAQFEGATVPTEAGGVLSFSPTHLFGAIARERTEPIVPLRGEQSNTSIRFGDALILKLFRRVQFGPNPDLEMGWFLTEHSQFRGTPPMVGGLEYRGPSGDTASVALLQRFEANRGDAWATTLGRVRAVLNGADVTESIQAMARLGQTTAELHLALAGGSGDFSAEPITAQDVGTGERHGLNEGDQARRGRGGHEQRDFHPVDRHAADQYAVLCAADPVTRLELIDRLLGDAEAGLRFRLG